MFWGTVLKINCPSSRVQKINNCFPQCLQVVYINSKRGCSSHTILLYLNGLIFNSKEKSVFGLDLNANESTIYAEVFESSEE